MKILYIVSNLRRTGPTNQLYYIIKNLPDDFRVQVLTLFPEPSDSLRGLYEDSNIKVESLNLSRLSGMLYSKKRVEAYVNYIKPDIIQTQGLRADGILSTAKLTTPWITTSRNFPKEDYPSKFGFFRGRYMALLHTRYLSSCNNLVSCSEYIHSSLHSIGIKSRVIQNGTVLSVLTHASRILEQPLKLISVGSLIPRKNMNFILELSDLLNRDNIPHTLKILGDGPLRQELEARANSSVEFLGNVVEVREHLSQSDIFVSASYSEGLPNTVLEAISEGLSLLLSDIPPHREITKKMEDAHYIHFSVDRTANSVFESNIHEIDSIKFDREEIKKYQVDNFSDSSMSMKYQSLYKELYNDKQF